jgi:Zn-dependent protease with chaperone function
MEIGWRSSFHKITCRETLRHGNLGRHAEEKSVSLKLVLGLSLAALPAVAQGPKTEPSLYLELNDPSRLRAWLYWIMPVPETVAQALARSMGCPPAALPPGTRSNAIHVECAAPLKKDGLRWSEHWDLSALNDELERGGTETLEVHINYPRSGFAEVRPAAISETQWAGFGASSHGKLRISEFHEIALESGFRPAEIRLLAGVTGVILLLPLVLFAARAGGGPLFTLAGAYGLFCVAATVWLWETLRFNTPGMAPLPWNLVIVAGPIVVAVGIGAAIAGAPLRRAFFWRGTLAVALLTLMVGIFSAFDSITPWAGCCGAVIVACLWQLYRGGGGRRVQRLTDGELMTRVRELAVRAGTTVRGVHLLVGGDDRPAAFATRFRGILLTGGLLSGLSRREVDAIVAHELSHVRRPSRVAVRGLAFLMPVMILLAFVVPASLQWMPLMLPPLFLLQRALRRRIERVADADSITWSGDAEALITGLTRVTNSHGMPMEWPLWVKPLMPHPSTMERVRAAAGRARIPEDRFQQLLASASEAAAADHYTIPGPSAAAGTVFTPAQRARLNLRLSLAALTIPVAFGVAAPFVGYLAAFLTGAPAALLVSEWIITRSRKRARALLAGRPGVFCGFRPAIEERIYDGSYDYDWGFAAFEGDLLVFRGDRGTWSVARQEVEKIRSISGPFTYLPRPVICFQLNSGAAFCLRPFDHSFGPAASRAAARLLVQARQWQAAPQAGTADASTFDFSKMQGHPPRPFTWRMVLRSLPLFAAATLAIYWVIVVANPGSAAGFADLSRLAGPVAVTWGIVLFMAYPTVLRAKAVGPTQRAPLADTGGQ